MFAMHLKPTKININISIIHFFLKLIFIINEHKNNNKLFQTEYKNLKHEKKLWTTVT